MGFSFLLVTFLLLKCPWLPRCAMVKKSPANAEEAGDAGSVPGSGKAPGGGNGHPLQYSYLGSSIDRGARWAIVHWVTKGRTQWKDSTQHSTVKCL